MSLKAIKALLGLTLCLMLTPVIAQADFPNKPITLIVPFGSGATDVQYRMLAELASRELGQPIVVVNQPGASGTMAVTNMARNAAADGYTIAASLVAVQRQPHIIKSGFNPPKDLTWIAGVGNITQIFTVREDSPFKTLKDMVAWAKSNPGKLTFASTGTASTGYLAMRQLSKATGIEIINVPFKGGSELQAAVLGGHVMVAGDSLQNVFPATDGKHGIRALAILDPERSEHMPEIPTFKEQGYDIVQQSPYGFAGPKGMQPAIVKKLEIAFERAAKHPENTALLKRLRQRLWLRNSKEYAEWAEKTFETERKFAQEFKID